MKNKGLILTTCFIALAVVIMCVPSIQASNGKGNEESGEGNGKGVKEQITQMQQQILTLQSTVKTQADQIATLQQGFTNLQNDQTGIKNEQIAIETDQQNIETELKNMEATQNGLGTEQRNIETELSNIVNSQQGIVAKEQGIESEINQLRVTIAALQNPTNPVVGHTFSGLMIDADGKPFFSGIYLTDQSGKSYSRTSGNLSTGEFAFINLPDGTYDIHFYYPGYVVDSPKQVTLKGADITNVTVKLAVKTYILQGTATKANGTPLSDQPVTLKDPQNVGGYWAPTGADGSFTLKGIAPGSYTIQIGNPNQPLATLDVTVKDQDIMGLQVVGQ